MSELAAFRVSLPAAIAEEMLGEQIAQKSVDVRNGDIIGLALDIAEGVATTVGLVVAVSEISDISRKLLNHIGRKSKKAVVVTLRYEGVTTEHRLTDDPEAAVRELEQIIKERMRPID
ncbi:hypothetical protein [Rathayibacter sp. VKM Ac-2754]|uniref:hypothetical protein n=1 Tax=Rathayibacter sp. VKM Ac-2754 TaxID=2609251 RepID=UPI00135C7D3F|nr:hypothetical protein [Rathayibacter sp. VKM Ac-2754]MWV58478.1 hypothetical protein [Rathayibacter sp. VKM Ac-2754]